MASNNESEQPAGQNPRRIIQSMPDVRQQSYDEIYGVPENVLEIEVNPPNAHGLPYTTHLRLINHVERIGQRSGSRLQRQGPRIRPLHHHL